MLATFGLPLQSYHHACVCLLMIVLEWCTKPIYNAESVKSLSQWLGLWQTLEAVVVNHTQLQTTSARCQCSHRGRRPQTATLANVTARRQPDFYLAGWKMSGSICCQSLYQGCVHCTQMSTSPCQLCHGSQWVTRRCMGDSSPNLPSVQGLIHDKLKCGLNASTSPDVIELQSRARGHVQPIEIM